ncbi:MAG: membrane protein insertase YidC [Hyphomicrobium sp.]|nr:membrane protein insertase YidC [Hyphomicrobium sp.]
MQKQQPDQLNLLLAVLLSMAVLLGWSFFVAGPQMKSEQERVTRERQAAEAQKKAEAAAVAAGKPLASAVATLPATRNDAITQSPRVPVETASLRGTVALKGGTIDDLSLVKHHVTASKTSENVRLFEPRSAEGGYFARYGWSASGKAVKVPDADTLWTQESSGALTDKTPLKLVWNNGEGLTFHRTISVDENYMFTIVDEVENKSRGDIALTPFARLFRFGAPKTIYNWIQHEGFIGVPGDHGLYEVNFHDMAGQAKTEAFAGKTGGWVGMTDKYWAAALVPDQKASYKATFETEPAKTQKDLPVFLVEYETDPLIVPQGSAASMQSRLFAGAKNASIIEGYGDDLGIDRFDLLIDWGWFYFLTKPMNHALTWLYGILGNFGLAILALTVFVKLVFFPLANKSYEAMARMKKLQPQMEELKVRFANDKPRMQQELMKLYQEEKINPLAGCLPILVQIPVFFALYKVLFVSIDMRHAPFFGWVQDLSAPDPTSIFNLFGLLPFEVPAFLLIGVWPIIMGVTMWVQMQLNPPQPDPVQQQVFNWMPLIFTFLLATFPAGLVIYWAWNNVLSIAQQWYISKKQGVEIHLAANLKKTFEPLLKLMGLDKSSKSDTAKS